VAIKGIVCPNKKIGKEEEECGLLHKGRGRHVVRRRNHNEKVDFGYERLEGGGESKFFRAKKVPGRTK